MLHTIPILRFNSLVGRAHAARPWQAWFSIWERPPGMCLGLVFEVDGGAVGSGGRDVRE